MKIKIFILTSAMFVLSTHITMGQISINNDGTAPDSSAILDVQSTDKGMLIPRMSSSQRSSIISPAEGLMVYDTETKSFWYVKTQDPTGSPWIEIITKEAGWSLTGNEVTNPSESFIGTTDSTPFRIKVNNMMSGLVDPTTQANTSFGYLSLAGNTGGARNTATGYEANYSNISGASNTANGFQALYSNSAGNSNIGIGNSANYFNQTGSNNTIIGFEAGKGSSIHSKSGNIFLGYKAGYNETGSDKLYIENSNSTTPLIGGNFATDEVFINGRVGIGTSSPNPSAKLEVNSVSQGFLTPRMTTQQILTISNPANGLIVFCTSDDKFYAYITACNTWKELLFGTAYIEVFSCDSSITRNHVAGTVAPVDKSVTYGTADGIPGESEKCWITSNLGADQQAASKSDNTEASAGWYWQFNRKQGYKSVGGVRTPSTPPWTSNISENSNWLAANDPCTCELGSSWRIPTYTEWNNVKTSGSWGNWSGTYNSDLKIHAAGYLNYSTGALSSRGTAGNYWSSSQYDNQNSWNLNFTSDFCQVSPGSLKSFGYSIRCIRE